MSPKDATPPPKPRASSDALSDTEAEALFGEALASMAPRAWEPLDLAEAARLLPGYEILSLLGRGGMGAVYLARQKSLDRTVALKLLPREISGDQAFVMRFTREAQTLGRLQHPNIVTAHEFERTSEGHFYFVMEYVEGTDLARLLRDRRLSPKEVVEVFLTICDALEYAHQQGIIHRDIKPANVLLGANGLVKVADFGLARALSLAAGVPHTQSGAVIGTPVFMAPEQLEGKKIDRRTDIYALGVTLYEMLCRELPRGAFRPPSQLAAVDRRFDEVISRAMRPQPTDRYQSVAALRAAVAKISARSPAVKRLAWAAGFVVVGVAIHSGTRQWSADAPATVPVLHTTPPPAPARPPAAAPVLTPPAAALAPATFQTATRENPYRNSVDMKFVPVPIDGGPSHGRRVLFCIWETRVQDFEAYLAEIGRPLDRPPFPQGPDHPIATATWTDAQSFCAWLTMRERRTGRIGPHDTYRLPTDHEWSCAVGLGEEEDPWQLPEEKNRQIFDIYPWGTGILPPPPGSENYSGEETVGHSFLPSQPVLRGYRDAFIATSPVGSLNANRVGLYDLSGNVREWCDDWFDANYQRHPQRGASFMSGSPSDLLSATRFGTSPQARNWQTGFRLVLTTTDMPIKRVLLAPPKKREDWVDWFAEQQGVGLVLPNFTREAGGWRYRTPLPHALFAPSLRDLTLRIRFRGTERFEQPGVLLRRVNRGNVIHTGYTAQIWKDGTARILKITDGIWKVLASRPVPDFDPADEVTLEFQAVGDQLRMVVNGHELSASDVDSSGAGTCWYNIPLGSLIRSIEYRLAP